MYKCLLFRDELASSTQTRRLRADLSNKTHVSHLSIFFNNGGNSTLLDVKFVIFVDVNKCRFFVVTVFTLWKTIFLNIICIIYNDLWFERDPNNTKNVILQHLLSQENDIYPLHRSLAAFVMDGYSFLWGRVNVVIRQKGLYLCPVKY